MSFVPSFFTILSYYFYKMYFFPSLLLVRLLLWSAFHFLCFSLTPYSLSHFLIVSHPSLYISLILNLSVCLSIYPAFSLFLTLSLPSTLLPISAPSLSRSPVFSLFLIPLSISHSFLIYLSIYLYRVCTLFLSPLFTLNSLSLFRLPLSLPLSCFLFVSPPLSPCHFIHYLLFLI